MTEPKRINDLNELRPDFKAVFIKWFNAANRAMANLGYGVGITETYRTQERQEYLYKLGRVQGYGTPGRPVTWTKDSNHAYRIAADFHIKKDNRAVWDVALYKKLYELVPPEDYGLESLAPTEWAHLQIKDADNKRTDWSNNPKPVFTIKGNRQVLVLHFKGAEPWVLKGDLVVSDDGRKIDVRLNDE